MTPPPRDTDTTAILMADLRAAMGVLDDGPSGLDRFRALVAQALHRRFNCSMASLWRIKGDKPGDRCLICVAAFSSDPGMSAEGVRLEEAQIPGYIGTLVRTGVYNAPDAQNDPHLAGLKDSYLVPQKVFALLDVAFQINGRLQGVLCIEERGAPRAWTRKDELDLRSAASVIGLVIARLRPDLDDLESPA